MKLCDFEVGLDRPLFLIAGPCVIESQELALETAGQLQEMTRALGIPFIYKSSYDKANRSSGKSFRGLGLMFMRSMKFLQWRPWSMCCKLLPFCAVRPILSVL